MHVYILVTLPMVSMLDRFCYLLVPRKMIIIPRDAYMHVYTYIRSSINIYLIKFKIMISLDLWSLFGSYCSDLFATKNQKIQKKNSNLPSKLRISNFF